MTINQVDVLMSSIGLGKWTALQTVTTAFASGLPSAHALSGVFVVPRIDYTCQRRSEITTDDAVGNNSTETNQCVYLEEIANGSLREVQCNTWDFDNSVFTNTITAELGLVCDKNYIRAMYMSLYMIGVLVASPTIGYLSDRYGRKTTFTLGCFGFIVLSLIAGWLPNISAILACRFLIGIMHVPVVKISYILGMESIPAEIRGPGGILLYFPWTLYALFFSLLGYLIRDWRWLMTASSLPSLLLLPGLWFLDESPHWLTVRGRYDEALQVLKKAARWNKATLPCDKDVIEMLRSNAAAPAVKREKIKKESCVSIMKRAVKNLFILFRTPRLRVVSAVMHLDFFVIDMVYYGLAFSGGNFKFDIFTYMGLLGLTELPSRTLIIPIVKRIGRKIPTAASLTLTGAILLCIGFIPSNLPKLIVTFVLLGRMTICLSSAVTYLYASELFPTQVRTRGISFSFMMGRVGSSIAPFITEYLGHAYPWAPSVVFGGAGIVAGVCSMALWDTRGLTLPDTTHFLESNDPRAAGKEIRRAERNRRATKKASKVNKDETVQLRVASS